MPLRFSRQVRVSTYLPPPSYEDQRPVRIECELRRDPLTGQGGRVIRFAGFKLVAPDLSAVIRGSEKGCPFCPQRRLLVTPLLPPEIAPEGRISKGEALLFPNISPYDRRSVVIALTERHFVSAEAFTPKQIADGIRATVTYFQRCSGWPGERSVLVWNYMPPAGAAIIHPHLQGYRTDRAGRLLEEELRRGRSHWQRSGACYWRELAESERQTGERFVARGRRTVWLTDFVSRSLISDLLVLFPEVSSLEELDEERILEFASGLTGVLSSLHGEGVRGFNLAFYSAPARRHREDFWLHARLSPRVYFNPAIESSDISAWQQMLEEPFMVRSPEELATLLRSSVPGRLPGPG